MWTQKFGYSSRSALFDAQSHHIADERVCVCECVRHSFTMFPFAICWIWFLSFFPPLLLPFYLNLNKFLLEAWKLNRDRHKRDRKKQRQNRTWFKLFNYIFLSKWYCVWLLVRLNVSLVREKHENSISMKRKNHLLCGLFTRFDASTLVWCGYFSVLSIKIAVIISVLFFSPFLHVVVVVVFIHSLRYRAKALVFCAFSYFAIALSPHSETCLIYVNADFSRLMLVMIAANKYNPFSMFPFIIFPFHMI